jgi:hypothetical protein
MIPARMRTAMLGPVHWDVYACSPTFVQFPWLLDLKFLLTNEQKSSSTDRNESDLPAWARLGCIHGSVADVLGCRMFTAYMCAALCASA